MVGEDTRPRDGELPAEEINSKNMYKNLRKLLNYIPFFVLIPWATFSQNKTVSQKYNSDFGMFEMYNLMDYEIELDTFLFKELNIKSVSDTVPSLVALIMRILGSTNCKSAS